MEHNENHKKCSVCGKDFRITRSIGDNSEAPKLIIENDKEKWVCSERRSKKE